MHYRDEGRPNGRSQQQRGRWNPQDYEAMESSRGWGNSEEGQMMGSSQRYGTGEETTGRGYYGGQGYSGGSSQGHYGSQERYGSERGGRWGPQTAWEQDQSAAGEDYRERSHGQGGYNPSRYGQSSGSYGQHSGRGSYGEGYYGQSGDYGGPQGGYTGYASQGGHGGFSQPGGGFGQQSYSSGRGSMMGKGPKGYTRSDERIREDVCDRLSYGSHSNAENVEVHVKQGEVTLTGTVDDRQAKRHIEDVAENVMGVKQVHNQLRIGSSSGSSTESSQPGSSQKSTTARS